MTALLADPDRAPAGTGAINAAPAGEEDAFLPLVEVPAQPAAPETAAVLQFAETLMNQIVARDSRKQCAKITLAILLGGALFGATGYGIARGVISLANATASEEATVGILSAAVFISAALGGVVGYLAAKKFFGAGVDAAERLVPLLPGTPAIAAPLAAAAGAVPLIDSATAASNQVEGDAPGVPV